MTKRSLIKLGRGKGVDKTLAQFENSRWPAQLGVSLLLACGLVLLDWLSYANPIGPFNIAHWNPTPALAIVWMTLAGPRFAPVVLGAAVAADVLIREWPDHLPTNIATSVIETIGFALVATVLRRFFHGDFRLRDSYQLWKLIATTITGMALLSVLCTGIFWIGGFLSGNSFASAAVHLWLGNTVGVLVTAPMLVTLLDSEGRQRLAAIWTKTETLLQFTTLVIVAVGVLEWYADQTRFFYVLFLPLIWITLRGGLPAAIAASAIVQMLVLWRGGADPDSTTSVIELQARVAGLTLTGLFLGAEVDERERTAERLKSTQRLAAAGETAAAIAHELNQPLSALANYASAGLLLIDKELPGQDNPRLRNTISKMRGEAVRAGEVASRLREFFLSGTLRLEALRIGDMADYIRQSWGDIDEAGAVQLEVQADDPGRRLMADRLQIELVLRNLLDNAHRAARSAGTSPATVRVSIDSDGGEIRFRVTDSGKGIQQKVRAGLFDPFVSGSSSGMGFGLAMSQTIAEAHGGKLQEMGKSHGEFLLTLPLGNDGE